MSEKSFYRCNKPGCCTSTFTLSVKRHASDVDGLTMDDKQECCTVWNSVVDIAEKSNLSLPVQEQRIVVSSLVYAVFAKEVKEKKINDN